MLHPVTAGCKNSKKGGNLIMGKRSLKRALGYLLAFVLASAPVLSSVPATQVQAASSKIWYEAHGGSGNGGGHEYENPGQLAPAVLVHSNKRMPKDGSFSVTFEPTNVLNKFGFFYTYLDQDNWLYVGYETGKGGNWYYEYKVNGKSAYPSIPGLPKPEVGKRMKITVSSSREALTVSVNNVRKAMNKQEVMDLTEKANGNGKFGFRSELQMAYRFTDAMLGTEALSNDWEFLVDREGQGCGVADPTPIHTVSGTVRNEAGETIPNAIVRIGYDRGETDASGNFSFGVEEGTHDMSVSAAGYRPSKRSGVVIDSEQTLEDVTLTARSTAGYTNWIQKDSIKAAVSKTFPQVYQCKVTVNGSEKEFMGQEEELSTIKINGTELTPVMGNVQVNADHALYPMTLQSADDGIDINMTVKISVKENDLTWEVTEIKKNAGCTAKINTIEVPELNPVTILDVHQNAKFAGATITGDVNASGDEEMTFGEDFASDYSTGFAYAFLTANGITAGAWSNSEAAGDQRITRNNGADSMALTSSVWYYEYGDLATDADYDSEDYKYTPVSELPSMKICFAGDENGDGVSDWQDGAIAYRDIMNNPLGWENTKDLVNYRISMNFSSQATNPYLKVADNIKKVYLATDGLPQAVMMKGYGSEGHDSANSEYGNIAERLGGAEELKQLNTIAHKYHTQTGIHINAQEAYPEAQSFNDKLINGPGSKGWGWLDQSLTINRPYDLGSGLRYKRLLQLYDQLNDTSLYANPWPGVVGEGEDETVADAATIAATVAEKKTTTDTNLDFMYLDVWYGDSWETRKIAQQFNSLGWRFSTEFGNEGEYDSTWQHWATEGHYGGSTMKGVNSDIARFIRNHQKDSFVLNYPEFKGTADNPLLGGFTLSGFEGWGSNNNFNTYMTATFAENLPTKFLQHYLVYKWENYNKGESPVGNHEKQITLKSKDGKDTVVVTRNETQRNDNYIERTITLNGKKVLDDVKYLIPWTDADTKAEKLYHYNYEGGVTEWELLPGWANLNNVVVYKLTDTGRTEKQTVAVTGGKISLTAEANTPYVVLKGDEAPKTVKEWSSYAHVTDTGFNSYTGTGDGSKLNAGVWSGDVQDDGVNVVRMTTGNKYLSMGSEQKELAVTTNITGLKAGTEYVAAVYVDNQSDAKAWIDVKGGIRDVSNYTLKSLEKNWVRCDAHNNAGLANSKMQVMLVSFTPVSSKAVLTLRREQGAGVTYFDDIRIVEKTLGNFQEDGSFTQNFESVVQGLYPFVMGPAQGVDDQVTHLSELHAPYTQSGWGNMILDDVIGGKWSLKHHGNNQGLIYRTIPQNLHFEPGVNYKVSFDYQAGHEDMYFIVVGNGEDSKYVWQSPEYLAKTAAPATGQKSTTEHYEFTVTGSASGQMWFGLFSNAFTQQNGVEYSFGQTDFILDNLVVTSVQLDAAKVTLKGVGDSRRLNTLQDVTWTSSDDTVVTVDENGYLTAVGKGSATITAAMKEDPELTAVCAVTVEESAAADILNEKQQEVSKAESALATAKDRLDAANKALEDANKAVLDAQGALEKAQADLAAKEKEVEKLQAELSKYQAEKNKEEAAVELAITEWAQAPEADKAVKLEKVNAAKAALKVVEDKIAEMDQKIITAAVNVSKAQEEVDKLKPSEPGPNPPGGEDQDVKAASENLQKALTAAASVKGAGQKDYTDASWKAFIDAYNAAEAGKNSKDAAVLTKLTDTLKRAQAALVKVAIAKGDTVILDSVLYKVTDAGKKTVTAVKGNGNKTRKTLTIPNTVTINRIECKVTEVSSKAFKGYKKLQTVKIGANVAKIGKNSFNGCKKLKTMKIASKTLSSFGKGALKGTSTKLKVTLPKKMKTAKLKKNLISQIKKAGNKKVKVK